MCRVSIYRVLLRSNSAGYTDVGPGCVCVPLSMSELKDVLLHRCRQAAEGSGQPVLFLPFSFVFFCPSVVFPAGWLHDELDERRTEVAQRRAAASHQVIESSCRSRAL